MSDTPTRVIPCVQWFRQWLAYHVEQNPSDVWPKWDTPRGNDFYEIWVEGFDQIGATLELARSASRIICREGTCKNPYANMRRVLDVIQARREALGITPLGVPKTQIDREQREAAVSSADCPECFGKGHARRRYQLATANGWGCMASLYCRCSLGRLLLDRDLRDPAVKIALDDLQARPELWDPVLTHATWSPDPARRIPIVEPGTDANACYVMPSAVPVRPAATKKPPRAGIAR